MKLGIVVSSYVPPDQIYVVDTKAAGALAEAVRLKIGDGDMRVAIVATDELKANLRGFAKLMGIEVVE